MRWSGRSGAPDRVRKVYLGAARYSEACICILRNIVGEYSWQEITLIPCHHPKTELLQNILKD